MRGLEPDTDADLLTSAVDASPVVFIAHLNSRREWPDVLCALSIMRPAALVFRSKCPGLLKLLARVGGLIVTRESDGAARCFVGEQATAAFVGRLKRVCRRKA